ncbi:hypothetical protein CMT87_02245 [Elizabethkingia anophelis]|nr:hypothetical protein CMT86_17795 [Elizabethkingia anophelis]PRQ85007.1 hypothetical protein CMT87_02245 [Elizabethkingia anophelis]
MLNGIIIFIYSQTNTTSDSNFEFTIIVAPDSFADNGKSANFSNASSCCTLKQQELATSVFINELSFFFHSTINPKSMKILCFKVI